MSSFMDSDCLCYKPYGQPRIRITDFANERALALRTLPAPFAASPESFDGDLSNEISKQNDPYHHKTVVLHQFERSKMSKI